MKILLLIDALDTGGAETHVITLAEALRSQGNDVAVLSAGGTLERGLAHAGVASLRFPSPVRGRRSVLGMWRNLLFLRRLVRQKHFDVVHAHTRRTALLLRLFRWLDRLCPPPIHGRSTYRRSAMRRLFSPAVVVTAHAKFRPRHRLLSFWGDATIAVSDDLRSHASKVFGVPTERIYVIPNGIDTARFCPSDQQKDADTLHVTFASRLDDDCSAVAYALLSLAPEWQALARAHGCELRITLIGGGTQAAEIAKLACALPYVAAIGACEQMEKELRRADIFVGVSRVALEAAFSGCAVILAGNEGAGGLLTVETLDAYATENFCCRSQGDAPLCRVLTEAFVSYLDRTPAERRTLIEDVRTRLLDRYGAARTTADTVSLYRKLLTRRRRLTVLIGGYAGCGNLGDDAVLRALAARLQRSKDDKGVPRTLLGGAPPLGVPYATLCVEALVGPQGSFDLPCHDRRRPFSPMRRADAFLLGGGALLQNCSEHGNRSLAYYLALAMLARLLGCPWYIVAGGVGPIRGRLPRLLTGIAVRTSREISVRDTPSRDLLCSLGIPPRRIRYEPDPVCAVTPSSPDKVKALLRQCAIPERAGQLLCVAPHGRMRDADAMIDLIRQRRSEGGFPVFFAFDQNEDLPLCRRLQEACGGVIFPLERLEKCKVQYPPEAWIAGIFSFARAVFTGRLHALILARVADTPAIIFPPDTGDEKLNAFANEHR